MSSYTLKVFDEDRQSLHRVTCEKGVPFADLKSLIASVVNRDDDSFEIYMTEDIKGSDGRARAAPLCSPLRTTSPTVYLTVSSSRASTSFDEEKENRSFVHVTAPSTTTTPVFGDSPVFSQNCHFPAFCGRSMSVQDQAYVQRLSLPASSSCSADTSAYTVNVKGSDSFSSASESALPTFTKTEPLSPSLMSFRDRQRHLASSLAPHTTVRKAAFPYVEAPSACDPPGPYVRKMVSLLDQSTKASRGGRRLQHASSASDAKPVTTSHASHFAFGAGTNSWRNKWTCDQCTLVNESLSLVCSACHTIRPFHDEARRPDYSGHASTPVLAARRSSSPFVSSLVSAKTSILEGLEQAASVLKEKLHEKQERLRNSLDFKLSATKEKVRVAKTISNATSCGRDEKQKGKRKSEDEVVEMSLSAFLKEDMPKLEASSSFSCGSAQNGVNEVNGSKEADKEEVQKKRAFLRTLKTNFDDLQGMSVAELMHFTKRLQDALGDEQKQKDADPDVDPSPSSPEKTALMASLEADLCMPSRTSSSYPVGESEVLDIVFDDEKCGVFEPDYEYTDYGAPLTATSSFPLENALFQELRSRARCRQRRRNSIKRLHCELLKDKRCVKARAAARVAPAVSGCYKEDASRDTGLTDFEWLDPDEAVRGGISDFGEASAVLKTHSPGSSVASLLLPGSGPLTASLDNSLVQVHLTDGVRPSPVNAAVGVSPVSGPGSGVASPQGGGLDGTYDDLCMSVSVASVSAENEEKLRTLKEFGYTNETFNKVLLQMHDGDVMKVVEDLQRFNEQAER